MPPTDTIADHDGRAYLEAQNVQEALSEAVSIILKERPANALERLAGLISAKAGTPALPPPTSDYLSLIGKTPMVRLCKMLPQGCKAKAVYLKLEMQNPGGSIKDRIAKNMLEAAEQAGTLKLGMTVVEATSGNTGIGLAMACAAKGCVARSRSSALWLLCSSAADHRSVES